MIKDVSSQIDAALAAGDIAAAVQWSRQALSAGDRDPFVRNLVAWQLVQDGEIEAAEQMLRQGLDIVSDEPHLLSTLGLALRRQGRLSEALRALDAAIAAAPGYSVPWLERGFAFHQGGSLDAAVESYRRAIALDPRSSQAMAGIAAIKSMQGEFSLARQFAQQALEISPGDAVARCAIARCDLAQGDAAGAVERVRALLAEPAINVENRSAANSLLGDGLAKLGDTKGAVLAYAAAKSSLPARFPHLVVREGHRRFIERLDRHIVAAGPLLWPVVESNIGHRGHAFLLGYPRSGTTLVETILASVDGVEVLEELPTFDAAEIEFFHGEGGLDRLDVVDGGTIERLRAAYWQKVADFGVGADARLFLDMDPVKSLYLPLIARLFPSAPVVVMRRDPRDVVLSCFRQNFAASPLALEFTTLEDTARHYDALMRLQRNCLARMSNPVLELRYEELVGDFDAVTLRLCEFLGLPWSESLRDFSSTARRINVNTASVAQVRKGLFNGGGQWRRFAAEMAPVMPILEPWIRAYGYAA